MKIIAEVVHEVFGHGAFVLLFGGDIRSVYVSLLWPYEFSRIEWNLPNTLSSEQLALVYAGGIIVCLCVSFLTQAVFLLKRRISQYLGLVFFWFSFWTLANSTGYLIIGGLAPFGDVNELIELGVLTSFFSLVVGLVAFLIGFVLLSFILRKILRNMFVAKEAGLGVIAFWVVIPVLVLAMIANPARNLQIAYVPLAFVPMVVSVVIEYLVLSKQGTDANPDNISKE